MLRPLNMKPRQANDPSIEDTSLEKPFDETRSRWSRNQRYVTRSTAPWKLVAVDMPTKTKIFSTTHTYMQTNAHAGETYAVIRTYFICT